MRTVGGSLWTMLAGRLELDPGACEALSCAFDALSQRLWVDLQVVPQSGNSGRTASVTSRCMLIQLQVRETKLMPFKSECISVDNVKPYNLLEAVARHTGTVVDKGRKK
jgi:hypothetical protein